MGPTLEWRIMRLPLPKKRPPATVGARLTRLREAGRATADDTGTPSPLRRRYLALYTAVALLAIGAAAATVLAQLAAPPPALARTRMGNGLPVRLVAVTAGPRQEYAYQPDRVIARRALAALGARFGDQPIRVVAEVPAEALTVWLWIGQPGARVAWAAADDGRGHGYANGPLGEPLTSQVADWGRATLAWVALTNYDRTADRMTFRVGLAGHGDEVRFTVQGPREPPRPWVAGEDYPLSGGGQMAELRLWSLRPADPARMTDLLSLDKVEASADRLLLADVDVRDRASAAQPGLWSIALEEALTDHGERLTSAADRAGLFWLTNARKPEGFSAVSLHLTARKWVRDRGVLVFRGLKVPVKSGETERWDQAADEPFPDGVFTAVRGERVGERTLRVTFDGRAPGGSELLSMTFAEGLDQAGYSVRPPGDRDLAPKESRSSPDRTTWRYAVDLTLGPRSQAVALAFRLLYRRVSARTEATLIGRVQPPLGPGDRAGLGVLLDPRQGPDGTDTLSVVRLVPGTRAAQSALRPGDDIERVDGLPAALLPRLLLRHKPGDQVVLSVRRDGRPAQLRVGLDPTEG